jgi:hypothetical protein
MSIVKCEGIGCSSTPRFTLPDSGRIAEVLTTGQFTMWDIYLAPNAVYMQSNQPTTLMVVNNASESYIVQIPELDVWV